jgi:lipoic acid synthetase
MARDLRIPDQRHPEKAHHPATPRLKKPDWIMRDDAGV